MTVRIEEVKSHWDANPCQSDLSTEADRRKYFDEIERKRYAHEFHVPEIGRFAAYKDKDVLEIGCGISTDGLQFARGGARYTGVDLTPAAIQTARERFQLYGVPGRFECANAEELPFPDASFDHVYSFGVIHHSPHPGAIVRQIHRVLRPGGTFCVMLYNRSSINYYIEIMFLRKIFRLMLYPAFMPTLMSTLTGFPLWKLEGHRNLLIKRGKLTKAEWISYNTDGPECPLAAVYNAREARELFKDFLDLSMEIRFFDQTHWPLIGRMMPMALRRFLSERWGWHRIIHGRKPL